MRKHSGRLYAEHIRIIMLKMLWNLPYTILELSKSYTILLEDSKELFGSSGALETFLTIIWQCFRMFWNIFTFTKIFFKFHKIYLQDFTVLCRILNTIFESFWIILEFCCIYWTCTFILNISDFSEVNIWDKKNCLKLGKSSV